MKFFGVSAFIVLFPFVMLIESTIFNPSRRFLTICFTWQCSTVIFKSSKTSKDVFYKGIKEAFSPRPEHGAILVVVNNLCSHKRKKVFGLGTLLWVF